jgi:excisionase family DNA binding protein
MAMIETKYLTIKEASEVLKVHENTIYNWIKAGKLKAVKIGELWRIPIESLP